MRLRNSYSVRGFAAAIGLLVAMLGAGDAHARVDGPRLTVDQNGCSVIEGDFGTRSCTLVFRLSSAHVSTVSFTMDLVSGSANIGNDFLSPGLVTREFAPGETSLNVEVWVFGDSVVENDENFEVVISSLVNCYTGTGGLHPVGVILDDDSADLLFFDGME